MPKAHRLPLLERPRFHPSATEKFAPILLLIGHQARVDPTFSWEMIDKVADEILPELYRSSSTSAQAQSERIAVGLKLVATRHPRPDDIGYLARTYAEAEQLEDALFWIGKAIEARPDEGEYLRFKASILERMRRFEQALGFAKEAQRLGAEPLAIHADIARIEKGWISNLRETANSENLQKSLTAYLALLEHGWLRASQIPSVVYRIIKLVVHGVTSSFRRRSVHS